MNTVTTTVDWLAYTAKELPEGIRFLFPDFVRDLKTEPCQAYNGYMRAVTLEFGIVVEFEGSVANMGAHYSYSGSTLQRMLLAGITAMDIVKWHSDRHHKPTRIDLAIDVHDSPNLMCVIRRAIKRGNYTTSVKKINDYASLIGNGETIEFGARTSPLYMRVYDKAAEQKLQACWFRIEIECKKRRAASVQHLLLNQASIPIYQTAATLAKHMFDCKYPSWKNAVGAKEVDISLPKPNESDTEKWLMESVAQCLARYSVKNPEKNILERFYQKVAAIAVEINKGRG